MTWIFIILVFIALGMSMSSGSRRPPGPYTLPPRVDKPRVDDVE